LIWVKASIRTLLNSGVAPTDRGGHDEANPGRRVPYGRHGTWLRAIGVIPLGASSSTSVIGGHVSTTAQAAPELDFFYFITDNTALELVAATTRHSVSASDTVLGHVDVGTVWALPQTSTTSFRTSG